MALNDRLGRSLATFCALVPIADERAVRDEVERWPRGEQSPFAAVPRTHFARFVIVRGLPRQVAAQPADVLGAPYLMLSAFFDGDPDRWVADLVAEIPDQLGRALGSCTGFPGDPRTHGHAVRAWLVEHRVPATAIFGAYPDASVDDVRAALAFRERFREFAFGVEERRTAKAAFRAFAEEAGR